MRDDPNELPNQAESAMAFADGRPLVWVEDIEIVRLESLCIGQWQTLISMRGSLRPGGPKYFGRTLHRATKEYLGHILREGRRAAFIYTRSEMHPELGRLCDGHGVFVKPSDSEALFAELRQIALAPGGSATFAQIMGS